MEIKTKIKKWGLIKLKSFCGNSKQSEMTTFRINETTDKGLISKRYNSSYNLNTRETTAQPKKWGRDLNRHYSKKDIQMANKHMKRCSTLLISKEVLIKTTMKYDLTLVRM